MYWCICTKMIANTYGVVNKHASNKYALHCCTQQNKNRIFYMHNSYSCLISVDLASCQVVLINMC